MRPRRPRPREGWKVFLLLIALVLAIPLAAAAEDPWDDEGDDWDSDDGGFGASMAEYGDAMSNRFLIGVNSLLTFPADPVLGVVTPREEFDELPAAPVSKRVVGLLQGTLLAGYRVGMGTLDMAMCWITSGKMLSPKPQFRVFPGIEHTEY